MVLAASVFCVCGGLNAIVSNKLIGSDTIRRCSFVGVGMPLLEEVCHSLGLIYAQAMISVSVHFLLLSDQDIEFLTPALRLLPCCCIPP